MGTQMKLNTICTLNSGAKLTVAPRKMHGEDTHLSIILNIDDNRIEVICSKKSIMKNGVCGYFSYSAKMISRKYEDENERRRVRASEGKMDFKPSQITGRDANCITLHQHLSTGLFL